MVGGGIESLVRLRGGAAVPAGPARGPVRREAHRPGLDAMLYREAGQFKSTYARGPADLPDPPGPHRDRAAAGVRVRRGAADRQPVLAVGDHHAVPDLRARRARPEHPHRLRRPALARHRGVHGGRRVHGLQLRAAHALARRSSPAFILGGLCAAAVGIVFGLPSLRIKGFYLAVATLACQFFVLWVINRVRLVLQLQHLGRDHRAEDRDPRLRRSSRRRRSTC